MQWQRIWSMLICTNIIKALTIIEMFASFVPFTLVRKDILPTECTQVYLVYIYIIHTWNIIIIPGISFCQMTLPISIPLNMSWPQINHVWCQHGSAGRIGSYEWACPGFMLWEDAASLVVSEKSWTLCLESIRLTIPVPVNTICVAWINRRISIICKLFWLFRLNIISLSQFFNTNAKYRHMNWVDG